MEDKNYIVYNTGEIGYIDGVCTCEECKKRGCPELSILKIDGSFKDSVVPEKLVEQIIYVGNDIEEGIRLLLKSYQAKIDIRDFINSTLSARLAEIEIPKECKHTKVYTANILTNPRQYQWTCSVCGEMGLDCIKDETT